MWNKQLSTKCYQKAGCDKALLAVTAQEYGKPVEMKVELTDSKEGWPYVVKFTEPGNFRVFRLVLTYIDAPRVTSSKIRIGIMGDSISTFAGELFDVEYKPHYPREQDRGTKEISNGMKI